MTIYWFMYLLPALLAIGGAHTARGRFNPLWIGVGFILIIIIGLRYEVGADWLPYWYGYIEAVELGFMDAVKLHRDPGYWFFNWLFANTGMGVWALNLLCALLSVTGIMAIAIRQPHPWVALAVAVPYILVVVSMGYTRQAAALGIVCWAISAIEEQKQWHFLLLVILATTFHKSAIVVLPLFLLTLQRIRMHHWIIFFAVISFVIFIFVLETLEYQWLHYVEKQKISDGALIRSAMNIPPAILLLLFREKLGLVGASNRHWYGFSLLSLVFVFLVPYASTAVDRLALYLLPLQMVVFSRVYRLFTDAYFRISVLFVVLFVYAGVLFIWLNYAKHSSDWIPYQFYPFVALYK